MPPKLAGEDHRVIFQCGGVLKGPTHQPFLSQIPLFLKLWYFSALFSDSPLGQILSLIDYEYLISMGSTCTEGRGGVLCGQPFQERQAFFQNCMLIRSITYWFVAMSMNKSSAFFFFGVSKCSFSLQGKYNSFARLHSHQLSIVGIRSKNLLHSSFRTVILLKRKENIAAEYKNWFVATNNRTVSLFFSEFLKYISLAKLHSQLLPIIGNWPINLLFSSLRAAFFLENYKIMIYRYEYQGSFLILYRVFECNFQE